MSKRTLHGLDELRVGDNVFELHAGLVETLQQLARDKTQTSRCPRNASVPSTAHALAPYAPPRRASDRARPPRPTHEQDLTRLHGASVEVWLAAERSRRDPRTRCYSSPLNNRQLCVRQVCRPVGCRQAEASGRRASTDEHSLLLGDRAS
jgi:hypothetical protein